MRTDTHDGDAARGKGQRKAKGKKRPTPLMFSDVLNLMRCRDSGALEAMERERIMLKKLKPPKGLKPKGKSDDGHGRGKGKKDGGETSKATSSEPSVTEDEVVKLTGARRSKLIHYLSSSDEDKEEEEEDIVEICGVGPSTSGTGSATAASPEDLFNPLQKLKKAVATKALRGKSSKEPVKRKLKF